MQIHTTLQPATYCELALAVTKMQATSRQEECCEQNASNMAARTLQMHMRIVVVKRELSCSSHASPAVDRKCEHVHIRISHSNSLLAIHVGKVRS